MTRIPEVTRDGLDAEGQAIYDRIATTRGALRGPYGVLLHHPALAERVGALGEQLRFHSMLPGADRELAILAAGREAEAPYEWAAHEPIARRAGTRPEAIAIVQDGRATVDLTAREVRARRDGAGALPPSWSHGRRVHPGRGRAGPTGTDRAGNTGRLLRDDRGDSQRLRGGPARGWEGAVLPARRDGSPHPPGRAGNRHPSVSSTTRVTARGATCVPRGPGRVARVVPPRSARESAAGSPSVDGRLALRIPA